MWRNRHCYWSLQPGPCTFHKRTSRHFGNHLQQFGHNPLLQVHWSTTGHGESRWYNRGENEAGRRGDEPLHITSQIERSPNRRIWIEVGTWCSWGLGGKHDRHLNKAVRRRVLQHWDQRHRQEGFQIIRLDEQRPQRGIPNPSFPKSTSYFADSEPWGSRVYLPETQGSLRPARYLFETV